MKHNVNMMYRINMEHKVILDKKLENYILLTISSSEKYKNIKFYKSTVDDKYSIVILKDNTYFLWIKPKEGILDICGSFGFHKLLKFIHRTDKLKKIRQNIKQATI